MNNQTTKSTITSGARDGRKTTATVDLSYGIAFGIVALMVMTLFIWG